MKHLNILKNKAVITLLASTLFLATCNATDNMKSSGNTDLIYETPLHDAVRAHDLNIIKTLTNEKNINMVNEDNTTALHLSVSLNQFDIASFLIDNGANVNTTDRFGDTPLLDATRNKYTNISELLLCHDAKKDVTDKYKLMPLDYAKKTEDSYVQKLLTKEDISAYCNKSVVSVTLLEHNKPVNAVVVKSEAGDVVIDKPYTKATIESANKTPVESAVDKEAFLNKYGNFIDIKNPEKKFTIYFDSNSTEVTSTQQQTIDDLVEYIQSCPTCEVIIVGHSDTVGNKAYNQKLSLQRTDAIKNLLEAQDLEMKNITTQHFGEDKPLVETGDGITNEQNRRVEVTVR